MFIILYENLWSPQNVTITARFGSAISGGLGDDRVYNSLRVSLVETTEVLEMLRLRRFDRSWTRPTPLSTRKLRNNIGCDALHHCFPN